MFTITKCATGIARWFWRRTGARLAAQLYAWLAAWQVHYALGQHRRERGAGK